MSRILPEQTARFRVPDVKPVGNRLMTADRLDKIVLQTLRDQESGLSHAQEDRKESLGAQEQPPLD
jgi:hypothetical protein